MHCLEEQDRTGERLNMKKICVHSKSGYFHPKWIEFLQKYGAEVLATDLQEPGSQEKIKACDGVMWHLSMNPSVLQSAGPILNPVEFALGKKVFPNFKTRWHFEDKFAQKYLFDALEVKSPATYCFWNIDSAMKWVEEAAQFPLVHKNGRGAGSVNVSMANNKQQAIKKIKQAFSNHGVWHQTGYCSVTNRTISKRIRNEIANFAIRLHDSSMHILTGRMPHLPRRYWLPEKDCVLFQEFMPKNEFDTRITVIGDRAFGFRRWNRPDDFRASGGGKLDHSTDQINLEYVRMAFEISRNGGFQSMAYDFLKDADGNPVVCEMSFGYQNKAVYDCSGHWDKDLNWHQGQMWPEEAHVFDFLHENGI